MLVVTTKAWLIFCFVQSCLSLVALGLLFVKILAIVMDKFLNGPKIPFY